MNYGRFATNAWGLLKWCRVVVMLMAGVVFGLYATIFTVLMLAALLTGKTVDEVEEGYVLTSGAVASVVGPIVGGILGCWADARIFKD